MPRKPPDSDMAQALAVQALTFLSADDERLGRFLEITGLRPSTVRAAATSPDFLAGVLDYVASDETLLVDCAAFARVRPEEVMMARHVLSPVMD